MEYIIGLVVALIGGLLFYRNKAKEAEVDSKLAETRGRDKELEITQEEVEEQIRNLDEGIARMKEKKAKADEADENLSAEERANRWNND